MASSGSKRQLGDDANGTRSKRTCARRRQDSESSMPKTKARRASQELWDGRQANEYICPVCKRNFEAGEFWIQCDACLEWYHGMCMQVNEYEANMIDKFHCTTCTEVHGPSVLRRITNKHRHDVTEEDADSKPVQSGTNEFVRTLQQRHFAGLDEVENGTLLCKMRGHALTMATLIKKGFDVPILVESKDGLEIDVPPDTFTVDEVMNQLGPNFELDVIDVTRQISVKMKIIDFLRSLSQDKRHRSSVYNCISLEVSKTPLSRLIKAPAIVNRLSWVERCWPLNSELRPAVSKYCLMSMENSFTDFHIDFGGTSVWYHVLKGEKTFYFVQPTSRNLREYERWMNMKSQSEVFFGDLASACYKLTLYSGQTLLIPTGTVGISLVAH